MQESRNKIESKDVSSQSAMQWTKDASSDFKHICKKHIKQICCFDVEKEKKRVYWGLQDQN